MRGRSSSPTGARLQSLGGGALENGRRVFGPVLRLLHLQEGCVRREEAAGGARQRCPRSRSTVRAFTSGSVGRRAAHRTQPLSDTLPHLHRHWAHLCPHLHRDRAHLCPHLHREWAHPSQIHLHRDRALTHSKSAPGLGSPLTHLRRDRAHHMHRDWAQPAHICTGTGLTCAHICTETGLTPATSAPGPRSHTAGCAGAGCTGGRVRCGPDLAVHSGIGQATARARGCG
jgi:hypothetical protein